MQSSNALGSGCFDQIYSKSYIYIYMDKGIHILDDQS